jgi:hypothetical protein
VRGTAFPGRAGVLAAALKARSRRSSRASASSSEVSISAVPAAGPPSATAAARVRRAATRAACWRNRGSRILMSTSSGVASSSDEIAPARIPTIWTSARSASVPTPSTPTPTIIRPMTGSTAMSEVLIDRISVWLSARLAASPYVRRVSPSSPRVFSRTLSNTTTVS